MQIGIVMAINLLLIHQYVSFSRCPFEQDAAGLVGLSVSALTYLLALMGLYGLFVPAAVSFIISNGQTWRQRNAYWKLVYSKVSRDTFKPKALVYPGITALLFFSWLLFNCGDLMQQDFVIDSLIMLCLFAMWVTQPRHLRHRDLSNITVIVVCLKLTYFNDMEQSENTPTEPDLKSARLWVQKHISHLQVIPLILCIFLENKMARHYSFGALQKLQMHGLTAALICYQVVVTRNNLILETGPPKTPEEEA